MSYFLIEGTVVIPGSSMFARVFLKKEVVSILGIFKAPFSLQGLGSDASIDYHSLRLFTSAYHFGL